MKKVLVIRHCSECHLKCDERTEGGIPEFCPLPGTDLLFSEMANLHIERLEKRIEELEREEK